MRSATESGEQDARSQPSGGEITPEQIRAELDKILASEGFVNADRLTRFLRYAVEETLEGQTDRLKETGLGIEVFGRKPSYDPRIDAVVRTEAVKLRARLKEYYEGAGKDDPVRIDLPKGAYVPAFRHREEVPEPAAAALVETAAPTVKAIPAWKSIAAGMLVVLVLAASVWIAVRKGNRAEPRPGDVSSIAVLPFEDLSAAHDQEYFCDGMTEEIIDALTRVGGFRVVARTSSFAFKGKQQDIREIGRKLNVGAVLEGSVRKFGNKMRVTAQLNSVADGYHLWSQTYEREVQDVFSVQDEISESIVNTLQMKLAVEHNTTRPKAPANLEAYDLYLKGRYHWARWRNEGATKAVRYFEQTIEKDPTYAPAYAGLADSYTYLGFFGALAPKDAMPKARKYAEKAIELDSSLALSHVSLGWVNALYDFDWPAAEREFKQSIELNPGLSEGHFAYGIGFLAPLGRINEALREMKMARDLDPLSLATNTYLGLAYNFAGQQDQAIVYYKKALELDPTFTEAHSLLARVYCGQRRFELFSEELEKDNGEPGSAFRITLARAYGDALQGKRQQALAEIKPWEQPQGASYIRATSIANVYAALGDMDHAMQWLDRAWIDRDGMLAYLHYETVYKRSDPRFIDLMHRLGLTP